MIREYKLNTAGQLDLGWRDVEFWLSLFPNLTQADLDNPRLFTPNLESMVEPKNKEQEWEIVAVRDEGGRLWYTDMKQKMNEKIDTVKRLSDGQTFSVGDEWNGGYTLTAFKIEDGVMLYEMNNNGYFYDARTLVPPTQKQQPPQEEQKDNNVFVWTDKDIVDFCNYVAKPRVRWGTGIMEEEIKKFKASKSTTKEERIEVLNVSKGVNLGEDGLPMGFYNKFCTSKELPEERCDEIRQAIWNVLNNYPNPEFGKAAYERLMDTNQEIMELMSKMYTEEQLLQARREAFEAARMGSRSISDKDGQMIGGFTYKDFDSYLQSLNNK